MKREAIICILENKGLPSTDINREDAVGYFERYITTILIAKDLKIKTLLRRFDLNLVSGSYCQI